MVGHAAISFSVRPHPEQISRCVALQARRQGEPCLASAERAACVRASFMSAPVSLRGSAGIREIFAKVALSI